MSTVAVYGGRSQTKQQTVIKTMSIEHIKETTFLDLHFFLHTLSSVRE